MVSVIAEAATNIPSVSCTNSGGLITFSIRKFLKGQDCFSPDAPYSDHNMVVWRGILLK